MRQSIKKVLILYNISFYTKCFLSRIFFHIIPYFSRYLGIFTYIYYTYIHYIPIIPIIHIYRIRYIRDI